jgi:hypothetical protein
LAARLFLWRKARTDFKQSTLLDFFIFASASQTNKIGLECLHMTQKLIDSMIGLSCDLYELVYIW